MMRHDNRFVSAALVGSVPILATWYQAARAADPSIFLILLFLAAGVLVPIALGIAFRSSKLFMLAVPAIFIAGCVGGTLVSSRLGNRALVAYCGELLRTPQAAPNFAAELQAIARKPKTECRVHENFWGIWQLGVYSNDELVGYIELHARDADGFRVSDVTPATS